MISVTVYLFGHYKDVSPDPFAVQAPDGVSASGLAMQLVSNEPKLSGMERICRVAVNEEYADNSRILQDGDEIAFIPPMSGG